MQKNPLINKIWRLINNRLHTEALTLISNLNPSQEIHLMKARCFYGLQKYTEALNELNEIVNIHKHVAPLVVLADTLLRIKNYEQARDIYDILEQEHSQNPSVIPSLSNWYYETERYKDVITTLEKLTTLHDGHMLVLVSSYIQTKQYTHALKIFNDHVKQNPYNPRIVDRLRFYGQKETDVEMAQVYSQLISIYVKEDLADIDLNYQTIESLKLPKRIEYTFQRLSYPNTEYFLVGHSLLQLLLNDKSEYTLDIIGDTTSKQRSLANLGFKQSPYNTKLLTHATANVTLYNAPLLNSANLLTDVKKRDFTISSCYLNEQGKLFDPTGKGIKDIAERRLTMIGNPFKRLAEDPVRALRAIRYQCMGFKPDVRLENALNKFVTRVSDDARFIATVRRHLKSGITIEQYSTLLDQYGLLEKLFNIQNTKQFERLIATYPLSSKSPEENYKPLKQELQTNPRLATLWQNNLSLFSNRSSNLDGLDLAVTTPTQTFY